jgi:uncharacterized metal-binding protein
MTRTSILITSALTALAVALAVAAGTARADDGPQITAGNGCAVQCVKQAIVTPTAGSAKVQIETTVTAYVTVSVKKQSSGGSTGSLTTSQEQVAHVAVPGGHMRTVVFSGLEPDTVYAIAVKARDAQGQSSTRTGSFKTLPVKTTVAGGPDTLDSGVGCSVKCVTKVLFRQAPPDGTVASIDVQTSTDAEIKVAVASDNEFFQLLSVQSSPGFVRTWKVQVTGLLPGTSYYVRVRATDRQGRAFDRQWLFHTVSATALVTIQKIKIVADGDKGSAKGELSFRYFFGGVEKGSYGFVRLGSGDVISARIQNTSRPGVIYRFPLIGNARLHVGVSAEECDGVIFKNCTVEASGSNRFGDVHLSGQHTKIDGTFRPTDVLSGSLPGWFGTGVSQPPGHDGYFVFGPANDYVKIQVLATVDIDYEWPS